MNFLINILFYTYQITSVDNIILDVDSTTEVQMYLEHVFAFKL